MQARSLHTYIRSIGVFTTLCDCITLTPDCTMSPDSLRAASLLSTVTRAFFIKSSSSSLHLAVHEPTAGHGDADEHSHMVWEGEGECGMPTINNAEYGMT